MNKQRLLTTFLIFIVILTSISEIFAEDRSYKTLILGDISYNIPSDIKKNEGEVSNNYIISKNSDGTKNNFKITLNSQPFTYEEMTTIMELPQYVKRFPTWLPTIGWNEHYYALKIEDQEELEIVQSWKVINNQTYLFSMVSSTEELKENLRIFQKIIESVKWSV